MLYANNARPTVNNTALRYPLVLFSHDRYVVSSKKGVLMLYHLLSIRASWGAYTYWESALERMCCTGVPSRVGSVSLSLSRRTVSSHLCWGLERTSVVHWLGPCGSRPFA